MVKNQETESLEQIRDHAFQRCVSLEEIVIPKHVDYIDNEAFLGCMGLQRVVIKSNIITNADFLSEDLRGRVCVSFENS